MIFFTQHTTYFRRLLLLVGLKLGLCVLKSLRGVSALHIWAFNWPVKPESFQSTKFLIVCHITAFLCILCIQECFHVYLTPISSSFFTKFALSKYRVIYCLILCGSKQISLMGVPDFFHLPDLITYLTKSPALTYLTFLPEQATFQTYLHTCNSYLSLLPVAHCIEYLFEIFLVHWIIFCFCRWRVLARTYWGQEGKTKM